MWAPTVLSHQVESSICLIAGRRMAHSMSMATRALFIPAQPPRTADWVPGWRGLFGERLRNTVYGWPEPAFDDHYRLRKMMGFTVHITTYPDHVGRVLLDNKENYLRPRIAQRILSPLVGNGLLSSEGDDWRKQRKIVAPTFAPGAVAKMTNVIAAVASEQVAGWGQGTLRLDLARQATDATMAIIADALFSGDRRLRSGSASGHIERLLAAAGQARLTTMLGLQDLDPSPMMARARKSRLFLRSTLEAVVQDRGPSGGEDDFFGGLIRSLHQTFPAEEANRLAVDNAITFYVAGHETTANALAWTIYLLAAQPHIQDRARDEAQAALRGDITTLADRVPYLRQILDEALRLYPPAPRFDREAEGDDFLGNVLVNKGDLVSLWPWVIHRHRKLWSNPDAFNPDRFEPSAKAQLHKFQYIPFGGGPRVCVGMRFAIVEALIILTHWLAARRFSIPSGFAPYPIGSVTLRPRDGMPLLVESL
jgi:cytochrome P450